MALRHLGAGVDVLAGGADLAFPHHAYQFAMAEAAWASRRSPGGSSGWEPCASTATRWRSPPATWCW